jgi:hypothetical protein
MNARAQGELAVGLLGLWAIIQAVSTLSSGVTMLLSWNGEVPPAGLLWAVNFPPALMLAFGYVMVRYHAAVMTFLFPNVGAVAEVDSLEPSVVIVGCLGLWIFASAMPSLVRALLMYAPGAQLGLAATRATSQRSAVGYILQAALGLFVALRPRRVLAIWKA